MLITGILNFVVFHGNIKNYYMLRTSHINLNIASNKSVCSIPLVLIRTMDRQLPRILCKNLRPFVSFNNYMSFNRHSFSPDGENWTIRKSSIFKLFYSILLSCELDLMHNLLFIKDKNCC